MKARLFSTLEQVIEEWVNEQNVAGDWPGVWLGNETATLMATAAAAVLDACEESQATELADGNLAEG